MQRRNQVEMLLADFVVEQHLAPQRRFHGLGIQYAADRHRRGQFENVVRRARIAVGKHRDLLEQLARRTRPTPAAPVPGASRSPPPQRLQRVDLGARQQRRHHFERRIFGGRAENPSFEVVSALLSRAKVYALHALEPEEIVTLLERALKVLELSAARELLDQIAVFSNGDARTAYNILELAASVARDGVLDRDAVESALGRKTLLYDKSGEEHFNLISALHKSVRSSDPDAALYWLARMMEGGEDRLYLARRLVRMAIEDIGLADPRALEQAMAAQQAVHFLGIPEGDQALAQIAIYLAVAPKSDASYRALNAARETIARAGPSGPHAAS